VGKQGGGRKGSFYYALGRPCAFDVDSSPSCFAIRTTRWAKDYRVRLLPPGAGTFRLLRLRPKPEFKVYLVAVLLLESHSAVIRLLRQRIGTELELHDLGLCPLAAFDVERRSGWYRSTTVPCPCSPLSDCRCAHPKNPAGCLRRSMISISIAMLLGPSTFFLSMINPCAAFSGSVRPRLPLLRTMFLAQCRHRLAKRWSVHR